MNFIEQQYHQIKIFYKENLKKIFPITVLLFILMISISSVVVELNPGLATRLLVKSGGAINVSIDSFGLLPIIAENAFIGLVLIICGIVPFLFIPSLFVIYNACVIGILFGSTSISIVTPMMIFANILPHGIFMIPANLIAASCGICVCKYVIHYLLHKEVKESVHSFVINNVRVYALIVLPMLVLASIVQMFITPFIVSLL